LYTVGSYGLLVFEQFNINSSDYHPYKQIHPNCNTCAPLCPFRWRYILA